jgi:hypothetical protein
MVVATTIPVLVLAAIIPVSQNLVGRAAPKNRRMRRFVGGGWLVVLAMLSYCEWDALRAIWFDRGHATFPAIGLFLSAVLVAGAFFLPTEDEAQVEWLHPPND